MIDRRQKIAISWTYLGLLVCLMSSLFTMKSMAFAQPNTLAQVVKFGLSKQNAIKAKNFELQSAQQGLKAAKELFGLQFNGTLDISDDLVTIPNPLEMGRRTAIETQRYGAELGVSQALKWGTVLGFGLRQSQIQTTNPFRNCVPGIISEQCYESSLTLRLNQALLRGSSAQANTSELQSARYELRLKQIQVNLESQKEIQTIATLYLQLSLAEAQYALEKEQLTLIERQLIEAQERIKIGVLAPSEIFSLQAAKAQKKQSVARVKGQALEARLLLSQKINLEITTVIYPDDWFNLARIKEVLAYPEQRSWNKSLSYEALNLSTKQLKSRLLLWKMHKELNLIWDWCGVKVV